MTLTAKQRDVLDALAVFGGRDRAWARPMDIGAWDGSHHTSTLRALIAKKFVERQLRGSLLNHIRGQACYDAWAKVKRGRSAPRGSYRYRVTPRGWKEVRS
jgi:hypothetical protein